MADQVQTPDGLQTRDDGQPLSPSNTATPQPEAENGAPQPSNVVETPSGQVVTPTETGTIDTNGTPGVPETTATANPDAATDANISVPIPLTETPIASLDQDQNQQDATTHIATVTMTATYTNSPAPSVSPEAAAGIGIGSAVASALLVFVAMFLLAGKKRRKNQDIKSLDIVQRTPTPQTWAYGRRPTGQGHAAMAVDFLPEPVAHSDLRNQFSSLIAGIKNCVDNYFHETRIILTGDAEIHLQAIAGRPGGGQTWSALLAEPTLCHFIIKSLIARVLLEWINPRSKGHLTLLDPDLRPAYQHFLADTSAHGRRKGRFELLSLWRTTSCTLSSSRSSRDSKRLHELYVELASALEPLRPLKKRNYDIALQGLVEEASRLGMTLWAQPDDWEVTWSDGNLRGEARVCVFPAVDFVHPGSKTALGHDEARRTRLVEAVIERTA